MTLLEIIEKNAALHSLVNKLYEDIISWYQYDECGRPVKLPMNIYADYAGKSARPCQENSFSLAKILFHFNNHGIKKIKKTVKDFQEFKIASVIAPKQKKPKNTASIRLPHQFIQPMQDIIVLLDELNAAVHAFQPHPTLDNIDFRTLLNNFCEYLFNHHYSITNIQSACAIALKTLAGIATTADSEDSSFEFSLYHLIDLNTRFYKDLSQIIASRQTDLEKEKLLANTLTESLGDPKLISMFEQLAIEQNFDREYRLAAGQTQGHWSTAGFWAPKPQALRDKFAPTLDVIKTGQFSLRSPK